MQQRERYETVVIGGGQAGLAVGYYLKRQGRSFVILDGNERIGDSWRARWDSLKLYSPASRDGLPGMRFPAAATSYPTTDEMADYLEAYAAAVRPAGVQRSRRRHSRRRRTAATSPARATGSFEADNVVVATGVFQKPHAPGLRDRARPGHHAAPLERLPEPVAAPGRPRPRRRREPLGLRHRLRGGGEARRRSSRARTTASFPRRVESRRGRFLFRVLFFVGTHVLTVDTPLGRKMRPHIRHGGGPLLRYRRKDLRAAGVERVLARTVGVEEGQPVLDDGRVLDVQERHLVHRLPSRLLVDPRPVRDRRRRLSRCSTEASSRRRQACTSSACRSCTRSRRCSIGGAGSDAERVARHIVTERATELAAKPERHPLAAVAEGRMAS